MDLQNEIHRARMKERRGGRGENRDAERGTREMCQNGDGGEMIPAVRRNGFTGPAKKGRPSLSPLPARGSALTPVTPVGPATGMHFHTLATTSGGVVARARALIGEDLGRFFREL